MGELLTTLPGGSSGGEDGSGANPRPGRVPEQELSDPRNLFSMAAELCIVFGKNFPGTSVLGRGA